MDNEPIPVGTDIARWVEDEAFQSGVWAFIAIDLSQISGKAKRINITIVLTSS